MGGGEGGESGECFAIFYNIKLASFGSIPKFNNDFAISRVWQFSMIMTFPVGQEACRISLISPLISRGEKMTLLLPNCDVPVIMSQAP